MDGDTGVLATLIEHILAAIDTAIDKILITGVGNFVANAWAFVAILLTMSIMTLGFMVWKQKVTLNDAIWYAITMVFLLSFYASLPYFMPALIDLVFTWPSQLANQFSSTDVSIPKRMAVGVYHGFSRGYFFAVELQQKNGWLNIQWTQMFLGIFIMVVTVFYAVLSIGLIIVNRLKLAILLLVSPLFILLGLNEKTKQFTQGWLQALITSMLALFFYDILSIMIMLSPVFTEVGNDPDSYGSAVATLIIMCLLVYMIREVAPIAQSIGGAYLTNSGSTSAGFMDRNVNWPGKRTGGGAQKA